MRRSRRSCRTRCASGPSTSPSRTWAGRSRSTSVRSASSSTTATARSRRWASDRKTSSCSSRKPAPPPGGRHAGLYHFALLFATRQELARAVLRLAGTGTRISGASDHGVSEAIYLRDPDDNGIELYVDRPRNAWPPSRTADERVEMYTIALDMKDLMREIDGEEPRPQAGPGLVMGHVHLHVGDVERALAFYRDVLGFEVMVNLGSAAFVSAGGYHHHLGFNVWLGHDVRPLPPDTAGLREWNVVLESADQIAAVRARVAEAGLEATERDGGFLVRDPWETAVGFTVG